MLAVVLWLPLIHIHKAKYRGTLPVIPVLGGETNCYLEIIGVLHTFMSA